MNTSNKPSIYYCLINTYLRFWHDLILYKKIYRINKERIPNNQTPTVVVTNHQNCLNDPLAVIFSVFDRKVATIARADVFQIHPIAKKFFHSIGLLPAFRLDFEGEEALGNNKDTFDKTGTLLLKGNSLVIFPEAIHQDRRWLGPFSLGYAKLIFETAERSNFETDIVILPACNHYSDYFEFRSEALIKYGEPISAKQFYEVYKTKPRTAQRALNALVRKQIEDLMLDIRDLENYDSIDFIRNLYRDEYAKNNNLANNNLPDKLIVDKQLCSQLEQSYIIDKENTQIIYNKAAQLKAILKTNKLDIQTINNKPNKFLNILTACLLTILFPVWIVSLWPAIIMYIIPKQILKTIDHMFESSLLLAINALLLAPITYTLTFIICGIFINWYIAAIYVLALPFISLFAWYYRKYSLKLIKTIRYSHLNNKTKFNIINLKSSLFLKLKSIKPTKLTITANAG